MRSGVLAVGMVSVILAAGAGAWVGPGGAPASPPGRGEAGHDAHPAHAHGHAHGQAHAHGQGYPRGSAGHEVAWSDPAGAIPDRDDPGLRRLRDLEARTDRGLAELAAQGWVRGAGSREDPFVVEGLRVARDLTIADTAGHLIVRNNVVEGQLTLNYVGHLVHVHHNRVRDLRVNENVERAGATTGGVVEHNAIAVVGQLRHFEGAFRSNAVGPRPDGVVEAALGDAGPLALEDGEVGNFDGFHGAEVVDNVVHGRVTIKLHGHEHGSCFACAGHDHAEEPGHDAADHRARWHALTFARNAIVVEDGPALVYRDTAHAADDRTAASEANPELELPHVHRTRVALEGNDLRGGGLVVRVFGARDDRHANGGEGLLRIAGNRIVLPASQGLAGAAAPGVLGAGGKGVGLDLHDAAGAALELARNEVVFEPGETLPGVPAERRGTGILLRGWHGSDLAVAGNAVRGAEVGLRARDFDAATTWALAGNVFDAEVPVDYDGSVANPPR